MRKTQIISTVIVVAILGLAAHLGIKSNTTDNIVGGTDVVGAGDAANQNQIPENTGKTTNTAKATVKPTVKTVPAKTYSADYDRDGDEGDDRDDDEGYYVRSSATNTTVPNTVNTTATVSVTPTVTNTATNTQPTNTSPTNPSIPSFTLSEVANHSTRSDCYTAISGSVYNLTSYISKHPGGAGNISMICGKDGTQAFADQHGGQGKPAEVLATLKIGVLK